MEHSVKTSEPYYSGNTYDGMIADLQCICGWRSTRVPNLYLNVMAVEHIKNTRQKELRASASHPKSRKRVSA